MTNQEFGPRRSRASRKPWPDCPGIVLWRCPRCGALYQALGAVATDGPHCCAGPMVRLEALPATALEPGLRLEYAIVGGFNQSAVQVFWESGRPDARPDWIMLRTFTGSAVKYPAAGKQPPVVFPLADEDAYVYCDRPVCQRCVFRCKLGFVLYLFFAAHGLVELPLDRVAAYFQTAKAAASGGEGGSVPVR